MRLLIRAFALVLFFSPALTVAQEFPVTITHKFGATIITEKPVRVVSLSYQGHDNFLALGVKPIALRYWYGSHERAVWPWAEEKLGDASPVVLRGEINIEQIAALNPDVIEAMWSGITKHEFKLLSRIAPVVPSLAGYNDYQMPWQEIAETTGTIVGKRLEAKSLIDAIYKRTKEIRATHPDWQNKTAAIAHHWGDSPGAFTSDDIRAQLLSSLGFKTPEIIDRSAGENGFFMSASAEDLSPLEADVLIWFGEGSSLKSIRGLPLRKAMKAHKEGREIFADTVLASALSHGSLLSLPFALEELIPLIELAIDGDPKTQVPSSVEAKIAP
ncbi:MAG: ABC transporter substrate-binding protein [Pseudomonadota bacterium]